MKRRQLAFALALVYLWVVMVHFGALVFETFVVYPNIFHDVPQSLETAMTFMAVKGPHDFFPVVGSLSLVAGSGAVIAGWRVKSARYWLLGSLLIVVAGEFLLSVVYFWPRNTIMFTEGLDVHSAAYLQQVANEFQTGHWLRFGASAVASVASFVGFLKLDRHRIAHALDQEQ